MSIARSPQDRMMRVWGRKAQVGAMSTQSVSTPQKPVKKKAARKRARR